MEEGDVAAAGLAVGRVVVREVPERTRRPDVPKPRILPRDIEAELTRPVGRPVVRDDDLVRLVGLRERAWQALVEEREPVLGGDAYRDERITGGDPARLHLGGYHRTAPIHDPSQGMDRDIV